MLAFNGDGHDRLATAFYQPIDVSFAPDGTPWVIDWNNHKIRRVLPDQTVETVVGSFVGDPIDNPDTLTPAGAPGDEVNLNHPTDMLFRKDGTAVFAAWHNFKIASIDPQTTDVRILYGRGAGFAGDGGTPDQVRMNRPSQLAIDSQGTLTFVDQSNLRVRSISADGSVIKTVAGTGKNGFAGDGGPADQCELTFESGSNPEPSGAVAIDANDNIYVADSLNNRIREIDHETGIITTVAGDGHRDFAGDGGPALSAEFDNIKDLEFGPDGRLYVADTDNHRIRAIDLKGGTVETVAGSGKGSADPDGLPAADIELNRPFGIAFDAAGALYIADTFNSRVIKIPQ